MSKRSKLNRHVASVVRTRRTIASLKKTLGDFNQAMAHTASVFNNMPISSKTKKVMRRHLNKMLEHVPATVRTMIRLGVKDRFALVLDKNALGYYDVWIAEITWRNKTGIRNPIEWAKDIEIWTARWLVDTKATTPWAWASLCKETNLTHLDTEALGRFVKIDFVPTHSTLDK